MKINYELYGRCLWHEDCEKTRQGIMGLVRHEEGRSLVKCLHCGRQGWYPVGGVGPLEVEEHLPPFEYTYEVVREADGTLKDYD
jgi:hypothetical protein